LISRSVIGVLGIVKHAVESRCCTARAEVGLLRRGSGMDTRPELARRSVLEALPHGGDRPAAVCPAIAHGFWAVVIHCRLFQRCRWTGFWTPMVVAWSHVAAAGGPVARDRRRAAWGARARSWHSRLDVLDAIGYRVTSTGPSDSTYACSKATRRERRVSGGV
jgi:hypothetical protein